MDNNKAFIGRIGSISPIEGADKIVAATITLNNIPITQVVVGKDSIVGTLVVYFDSNLCLEQEVIDKLDRLSEDYGKDDFKSMGNYLAKGNRVRVIKLRKQISNGLIVELDKFKKIFGLECLVEGFAFDELNGTKICHKYVVPSKPQGQGTSKKGKKEKPGTKVISGHFPEHIDTEQLLRNIHKVNPEDVISISRKIHGTSSRTGYVLTSRKLSWVEQVAKFLGAKINDTEYHYVYGSRRVTKKIDDLPADENKQHFYSFDVWTDAGEKLFKGKLQKGEIAFYEIYGYLPDGKCIQKIKNFEYNYNCGPGQYNIAIYRMSKTDEDGNEVEYSTRKVKERCNEMGLPYVQEFYYGKAKDMYPEIAVDDNWRINFANRLKIQFLEKDALDCLIKGTPDEGIVLRVEAAGIESFKLKSERFLHSESEAAAEGKMEDTEDEEVSA